MIWNPVNVTEVKASLVKKHVLLVGGQYVYVFITPTIGRGKNNVFFMMYSVRMFMYWG